MAWATMLIDAADDGGVKDGGDEGDSGEGCVGRRARFVGEGVAMRLLPFLTGFTRSNMPENFWDTGAQSGAEAGAGAGTGAGPKP